MRHTDSCRWKLQLRRRHCCAGFNISLEPGFSVARLCYILAYNGVYAVANLRCVSGSCLNRMACLKRGPRIGLASKRR